MQQLRVTKTVDFTGAVKIGIGDLTNVGSVFYVDGNSGSDSYGVQSKNSNYPMKTINATLDLCTAGKDDYIIVKDYWNADGATITVDVDCVHIIGVGYSRGNRCMMAATGQTSIFTVTGDYCEIAGLSMGGGSTSAGIVCSGSLALWVHNCEFGNADIGDSPQYGILCTQGTVNAYMLIEDNIFLGSGGTSQGKISAYGIYAIGTNNCRSTVVRNNVFGQIPTTAILFANAYGAFVLNNVIACPSNAASSAIVVSGSTGCLIDGNHANYGKTDMTDNYPFVDSGSANCWGINYRGITADLPA